MFQSATTTRGEKEKMIEQAGWPPIEGGSIAPSLVKLKMASVQNIYHLNDKEEDERLR